MTDEPTNNTAGAGTSAGAGAGASAGGAGAGASANAGAGARASATAKTKKDRLLVVLLLAGAIVIAVAVFASWIFGKEKMPDYVGYPLEGAQKEQVIAQNSPLIDYVCLTPSADFPREAPISKITIHHMAADTSLESVGERFLKRDVQASANYGIDSAGNMALYVEEANRSWASKSRENDNAAITIEVANDEIGGDWHVSDEAFDKLIELCVDICQRNGIDEIDFTGDTDGNLTYHSMFNKNTTCPGPYLKSRMQDLADAINAQLAQDRRE